MARVVVARTHRLVDDARFGGRLPKTLSSVSTNSVAEDQRMRRVPCALFVLFWLRRPVYVEQRLLAERLFFCVCAGLKQTVFRRMCCNSIIYFGHAGLKQTVVAERLFPLFRLCPRHAFFFSLPTYTRYHAAPGSKRLRRASEVSAAEKGDLARPLSSIPELGAFAQQRLKLMVVLTNPAALDAAARVRCYACFIKKERGGSAAGYHSKYCCRLPGTWYCF